MSTSVGPWTAEENAVVAFCAVLGDASLMAADDEDEFQEHAENLAQALMVAIHQLGLAQKVRAALDERIAAGLTEADLPTIDRWIAKATRWQRVIA